MPRRTTLMIGPATSHGMISGKIKRGLTLAEQVELANRNAMKKRAEMESTRREAEKARMDAAERRMRINRR